MNTILKYLDDFSLTEDKAICIYIGQPQGVDLTVSPTSSRSLTAGSRNYEVILDSTIFYPQGGGQPCDIGSISTENSKFRVDKVYLDENGIVHHIGEFTTAEEFKVNNKVHLAIDSERRDINTKLHSAGHLLDCAVEKLGLDYLIPTKGYHFPDGPNVEYQGTIENKEELLVKLQQTVNELLAADLPLEIHDISAEKAAQQNLSVPPGKTARIINFKGFKDCGCGGTHVKNSKEISKIIIKKIKSKKGITKISYSIE